MARKTKHRRTASVAETAPAAAPVAEAPATAPVESAAAPEAGAEPGQMGCLALVARLTWLVFGNLTLLALGLYVSQKPGFSLADGLYWAMAALLVAVRYLDVTRLGGRTSDGEPATLAHWSGYAVKLTVIALAGWALAHLASRFIA